MHATMYNTITQRSIKCQSLVRGELSNIPTTTISQTQFGMIPLLDDLSNWYWMISRKNKVWVVDGLETMEVG